MKIVNNDTAYSPMECTYSSTMDNISLMRPSSRITRDM